MSWWSSAQPSPTKIIRSPPNSVVLQPIQSRRPPGGNLMDQCSAARHPISATGDLTNRPGHDLHLEIDQRPRFSQCSPAGGSVISLPLSKRNPRQEHADRFPLGSQPAWRILIRDGGKWRIRHFLEKSLRSTRYRGLGWGYPPVHGVVGVVRNSWRNNGFLMGDECFHRKLALVELQNRCHCPDVD